jgi:hypothetical protein
MKSNKKKQESILVLWGEMNENRKEEENEG